MSYDIHFYRDSKKSINEFKNALLYLFPEQKHYITGICKLKKDHIILAVNNDSIMIDNSGLLNISFDNKEIVEIVKILKNIIDKSYAINLKEFSELSDFYQLKTLNVVEITSNIFVNNYVIVTDNIYYINSSYSYESFFNKLKTIDYNTFLRSLKLKQII